MKINLNNVLRECGIEICDLILQYIMWSEPTFSRKNLEKPFICKIFPFNLVPVYFCSCVYTC